MYIVRKEFEFSASHSLDHLPDGHPCRNNHGHNYKVTVEFRSDKLDKYGFVIDYREMKPIKDWIDEKLDHQNLNDVFPHPSVSEEMASTLYWVFCGLMPEKASLLYSVSISETSKTIATYVTESK